MLAANRFDERAFVENDGLAILQVGGDHAGRNREVLELAAAEEPGQEAAHGFAPQHAEAFVEMQQARRKHLQELRVAVVAEEFLAPIAQHPVLDLIRIGAEREGGAEQAATARTNDHVDRDAPRGAMP
jgi:hypothetical protein